MSETATGELTRRIGSAWDGEDARLVAWLRALRGEGTRVEIDLPATAPATEEANELIRRH
jgi:hypothetical protein